jgi:hypothetical protein
VDSNYLQVNNCIYNIYIGCEISYEYGKGIQQKLAKFAQTLATINNIFKPTLI